MIKLCLVDDSASVRKLVGALAEAVPDFNLIHSWGDSQEALEIIRRSKSAKEKPDVIILDMEMPHVNGIEFLKVVMAENPIPVVIFSSATQQGSSMGIQALKLGAVEVVAKSRKSMCASGKMWDELVDSIRAAANSNLSTVKSKISPTADRFKTSLSNSPQQGLRKDNYYRRLIAIGSSTGGTHALEHILCQFPDNTPPVAIVQHMPEHFTNAFAKRLDSICHVKVFEAEDGMPLKPGMVAIAPGHAHMTIQRDGLHFRTRVKPGPPVFHHCPSVDVLFKSVAETIGYKAIGVILTGMGQDGANGLKLMHDKKSHTIAQDEASSVVYGMPAAAVKAGGVDESVSLDNIAQSIFRQA